jgi:hypothetical protein
VAACLTSDAVYETFAGPLAGRAEDATRSSNGSRTGERTDRRF